MALADVNIPLLLLLLLFALCSFELTSVAGNSIRPSEEEKKSIERYAVD